MDYFGYNDEKNRKVKRKDPEPLKRDVIDVPEDHVMDVTEDPLSETGVQRFQRRITARKP